MKIQKNILLLCLVWSHVLGSSESADNHGTQPSYKFINSTTGSHNPKSISKPIEKIETKGAIAIVHYKDGSTATFDKSA